MSLNGYPFQLEEDKYKKLIGIQDYRIIVQDYAAAIERTLPVKIPNEEILFLTLPIAGRRGQITLKVDGSTSPELPGSLYLENTEIQDVNIGDQIRVVTP
ncbi:hypothetical protein [Salirhabdus salicampi]|uniref:hypothetical protein n=1 Tax=Salirhabdus salicampi TaxID=476102 RepID=UPI0020C1DFAD|nr:hypothetical protein [Salirhabdus salicampi]MCP8615679.1 hypothetical protein [Salirhabdus salicampi]